MVRKEVKWSGTGWYWGEGEGLGSWGYRKEAKPGERVEKEGGWDAFLFASYGSFPNLF